MNEFRRVAWGIAAFLAIVFAGDRAGGYILNRVFQSTKFRFSQLYSGDLPADIVFMGNSRGVHMFHRPSIEQQSGQRVANLSFNGMPAEMMPVIFADYLQHHQPPRTLFVEVSCVGRDNEPGSLDRFSILSPVSLTMRKTLAERSPRVAWFGRLSHLYQFNSELMWRSVFFRSESDQDWIMQSVLEEDWNATTEAKPVRVFKESQQDAEAIAHLIRIASDSGVETKFILAPYAPGCAERMQTKTSWLTWLTNELDVPIADYTDAISDRKSFADPIHLNPTGAKQLAREMIQRGELEKAP